MTPEEFPKLARIVSVLVAGHREARLAGAGGQALACLDQVLARFAAARDVALADQLFGPDLYDRAPAQVCVLTGDCDGVDAHARLAAHRLGLPMQVVSAAQPADIAAHAAVSVHFGCPDDILSQDDSAHGMRDELALLHADVLVAVWDGAAPVGNNGGVVRLIQRAIQVGTPVLWIDLQGRLRELDYTRVDGRSRFQLTNAVFEHALANDAGIFSAPIGDPLTPTIRQWLDPLQVSQRSGAPASQATATLAMYAKDKARPRWWERRAGLIDGVCCALLLRDGRRLAKAFQADATDHWSSTPDNMALPEPLRARLAWTDVRANIAAGRHRSRIWLLYLLSAFAVLAAVAGALHLGVAHHGWQSFVWPGAEAAVLLAILALVRGAQTNRWHARWLGQRLMAEQLRNLALTRPFLGLSPFFAMAPFVPDARSGALMLQHVEAWLLRRALIVAGLPNEDKHYDLHQVDQTALAGSLAELIGDGKGGQIAHHRDKVHRMHALHHTMHNAARVLFGLSLLAVVYHLVAPWFHGPEYPSLLFATAFFPAFAAALHGIQTKLEIERIGSLSHRVESELSTMLTVINGFAAVPHTTPWQRTMYLRAAALQAAYVMSDEAQAWRELIAVQDSELPA
ncbi:hypothetical protein ACI48D_20025 [Massilia sp. LXY-6]|uniref:hypothetical protein n=1 Tax=Massilia sp. LXY-6 TaxID=3379823 RepID=UPI003EDF3CA8